jgi:hypothetical protein
MNVLIGILCGAVSGAITALLGYAKSVTVETFDYKKAVQTVIVGAVVGGFGSYAGMTYQQAYDYLISIGAITLIEYIKKSLWRLIKRER